MMKIEKVDCFILRVPLGEKRFYSSQCAFPERNSLLVRLTTDDGLEGWGEAGQYGPPEPAMACIEKVLARRIIGRNPLDIEVIWDDLYSATRDFGGRGAYIEAISAIDIALHDIRGKFLNQPVCQLLGGAHRTAIDAYATGCYYRGEDVLDYKAALVSQADEAKSYIDAGFKMMKMKVGLLSLEADAERVKVVRDAIGSDVKLLVDCNHAYNLPTAIRMARLIEPFDIGWLEEPVTPEDREGYRQIRSAVNIPISGGECEYTRYGFRELIGGGCVDIAQPNICVSGGLSEFQKICALASAYGTYVAPHVWGSGIAIAATLHAVAATPNFPHTVNPVALQNAPVLEFDRNPNPLRDELLVEKMALVNGKVAVPEGPGLGVHIDMAVLERYCTNYK